MYIPTVWVWKWTQENEPTWKTFQILGMQDSSYLYQITIYVILLYMCMYGNHSTLYKTEFFGTNLQTNT